jgi:hypothetical protein
MRVPDRLEARQPSALRRRACPPIRVVAQGGALGYDLQMVGRTELFRVEANFAGRCGSRRGPAATTGWTTRSPPGARPGWRSSCRSSRPLRRASWTSPARRTPAGARGSSSCRSRSPIAASRLPGRVRAPRRADRGRAARRPGSDHPLPTGRRTHLGRRGGAARARRSAVPRGLGADREGARAAGA